MKRLGTTHYTKAKPIGLRTSRTSRPVVKKFSKPTVQVRVRPAARTRLHVTPAQSLQRKVLRVVVARRQQAQVRAATALKTFFTRTLVQSAGMLVVLAVFGIGFLGNAQTSGRVFHAPPTTCTGWQNPTQATAIDLLGNEDVSSFTPDNSATIASRAEGAPNEPVLKCKGFALPEDFPQDVDIKHIQLNVSLAAMGHPDSVDALVIESSLDGEQWSTLDSFFLTEDTSNSINGGYRTFDFPALNKDNLSSLQVRVRFASVPSENTVRAYVDGISLAIAVRQVVSAEALNLPKNVVQIEKQNVPINEEPVVKVEVEKQARLKLLGFKDTKRTVDDVQVTSPEGTVQVASFDIQNVTEGSTTYAKVNIHTDKFTRPGKYTAQITVLQDDKLAVVTTEFTWGVLVINMNRSVYWPGETVQFGMGVLDPTGHTLCDAKLTLTVVAPDGTKTVKTTEQTEKGVQRSTTCGPDNVTDVADYSAEYDTFDEGNYAVTLTAKTASGEYTITDTVIVDAVIPYAISRRGSMRIYPPVAYTMALDVRPQKKFLGVVEDYVPPSFQILTVSDGGKVIKGQQRTTIRWFVDWDAGSTHTLTYRYDAPDISPEIFRLGPVKVADYQESRQWQIASDAVTPGGVLGFGETAADDNMQFLSYASPSTYTDIGNSVDVTSETNDIVHVTMDVAPTRDEVMSGQLKVGGLFNVTKCIGLCDAAGDWAEQLEIAAVSGTQTCDATAGACMRSFDIAYEQLSGRAFVAYGKTGTDGSIFYNIWNGTSWAGESSYVFNSGSAQDTLIVRLVAYGENSDVEKSNKLLLIVEDAASDIFAAVWDGTSAFGNLTTISTNASVATRQPFDGAWENTSGRAVVVYGESTSNTTTPFLYKEFDGTSTWDGAGTSIGTLTSSIGAWVELRSHSSTKRIAVAVEHFATGATGVGMFAPLIWKSDGSTEGWTLGNTDVTLETPVAKGVAVAWENYNAGTPFAMFVISDDDAASGADVSDYETWTSGTGFSALTDMSGAAVDDSNSWFLFGSPNSDELIAWQVDIDSDLCVQRWSGTAWDADCSTTEYSTTLPPDNVNANKEMDSLDFVFRSYEPWSRNWRFYDDETTNDPSTGLNGAAENAQPTAVSVEEFVRLRMNFAELASLSQIDARKKLQWTTGDPNSTASTWTDVGDTGETSSVWRYATSGETCGSCADNTAIATARLTGTDQTGNGHYLSDKDAAAGTAMDHTALKVMEIDFPLKAEAVTIGSIYYFRVYDLDQLRPVYREQDNDGSNDCASAACTYPNLQIGFSITGTVYNTDESTQGTTGNGGPCDSATAVLSARVNGGTAVTAVCSSSNASYTTYADAQAGDTITLYLTSSAKGNTVYVSDGAGDSGVDLYIDTLIVRDEQDGTVTILDLLDYDNTANATDMLFDAVDATPDTLTTDASTELHVWTGDTLTPGGTVTTNATGGDFHVDDSAIATLDTATSTIGRDILVDASATLNINASTNVTGGDITTGNSATIAYSGTPTVTISTVGSIGGGTSPVITFYNLTTSGSATTTQASSFTVAGDLTIATSTTFATSGSPTLTMSGSGKKILSTGSKTFYNLAITASGVEWEGTGTNVVANDISVATAATFNQEVDISVQGGDVTIAGTGAISATTGNPILTMSGTSATGIGGSASGTVALYRLTVSSGTTTIAAASGGVVVANLATVSAGATLSIAENMSVGAGLTNTTTGIITSGATKTLTMTGTGNLGGGNASTCTLGNLTLSGTATVTLQSSCIGADGDVNVPTSTTFTGGTNSFYVYGGDFYGDGTVTFTGGTVTIRDSGNFAGATAWTFNNLYFDIASYTVDKTTTAQGAGGITVNGTLTTTEVGGDPDEHVIAAGSKTWVLTKSGTGGSAPFVNNGRLDGNTSTFRYTGTSATQIAATSTTGNNYYNLELKPDSASSQTYTPGASLYVSNNMTVGNANTNVIDAPTFLFDDATSDVSITVAGTFACFSVAHSGLHNVDMGSGTWSIVNFSVYACTTVSYETGHTLRMTGTAGVLQTGNDLYNLTVDPLTAGTTTADTVTVVNNLRVQVDDTLSIASSNTVTASGSSDLLGSGTISGAGTLRFTNTSGGPGTALTTISSIVRFDATGGDIASTTLDARTYSGKVEMYSGSSTARNITFATGAYVLSGASSHLYVIAAGSSPGNVTLVGATNSPTVTVGGDLDFTGSGTASEVVTSGTGTWTVSGNVDFSNGTYTATSGNTLVMDGTSKTLTSNAQTLQNLTLSGTISLVNATTYTVAGNLVLGGTVTPGTSTVNMTGTSNTITGGGFTLYNLTINPSSAGTITLQTSDLTVSNTLDIATGDALTINASRTLTHTGATLTHTGTLNGPGRLTYRSATAFPTGGTLAASLILRMDATANDQSLGQRTDYQLVEIDNSLANTARTITLGTAISQTITFNGTLELMNTGTGTSTTTFQVNTHDPTFTVLGNVTIVADTTFEASSATTMNFGAGFSKAAGTFTHNSGTVALTTVTAATIAGSTTFNNLSVTGIGAAKTITFTAGTTQTIVGTWTVTGTAGNLITLQSSAASAWTVNPTAASVSYANISWSTNTGVAFCATFSTDGNNNTGWSISTGPTCGIDVAGTSNSSGGTVKVAVNSSIQAQTTTLAGSWTITGVSVSSGDKVTVFVDAAAEAAETTGVTKYDGTGNIGGLVLDTNVLTAGSDDNASLVLTDLGLYDNDQNENIMHTANASVLTVDGGSTYSTEQITIKASNTLTIGTTETLSTHHLNNAGTLVGTGSATFDVFGNWTNSSTFTHNTSTVTFKATGTGQTINNGASSFYNVTFNGSGGAWSPLTNTLTVTNDLIMTAGTFNTATGTANVTVNGNVQCLTTCGTITMNSAGTNTFTQSVAASKAFGTNVAVATNWTFYNLTFTASSGTPTITFNATGTGQTIVANTLATTNSGTSLIVDNETNDRIIDANGAVTIGTGTTFQASSTAAFTVAGNWTNNGDFTDGSGTVTLDGASQQTVDGQLTGANDRFNNLIITNASGSDPETSPSVIFAASADTAGTFTAATASTKLRFLVGGTYTLQNISFNGQATGTRVALRSSTTGTSWALNVAGTRTVAYTDVRDSNACGQAPDIQADDGTNADGTGNSCWKINTLTVTLSATTAALGTLLITQVNQVGITNTVTSSASGGYISMIKYNNTLTSGSDTIDDTTGGNIALGTEEYGVSTSDSGNTIAQWSPAACANTASTSTATALTTAFQSFASAAAVVTNDATTLCFLASISATTIPGSYTSTATLVTTAKF